MGGNGTNQFTGSMHMFSKEPADDEESLPPSAVKGDGLIDLDDEA